MIKTNLPIIFLRDVVLLPNNDLRIEFSNDKEKAILTESEINHDGYILLINLKNPLEENPLLKDLPKIGILAKIKTKIELPNGIIRIVITGLSRVEILNYIDNQGSIEAFISSIEESSYDEFEASALKRILIRDLNNYINISSYMSNSVLGRIDGIKYLGTLSDIITSELPISYLNKYKYIHDINPMNRARMLIEDLNKEIETIKLEDTFEEDLKKTLDNNQKEYILKEKLKLIKEELGETDLKETEIDNLKTKINNLKCPPKIKKRLIKELNKYEITPTTSPEITIISSYIDNLLSLPWEISTKDVTNLSKIKETLDNTHYGLEEIKERILEYIAVKKHTNNKQSNIICLVGPPGTGKTSFAKSIANALNKKFVKISVGGVSDEAEIMGHRRTYIGANPGKIILGLKKCGANNPVFLIDEIDKITKDIKGDPASSLLDILDKEQNNIFTDNYIDEEFDLSNVMFILTANDETKIPEALKDRLEIIKLSSYTLYEKVDICQKHIIKKLEDDYNLKSRIIFDKEIISYIIESYTKESGVRELERQISKIFRKVIIDIQTKKELNSVVINKKNIVKYLGEIKYQIEENIEEISSGVVNGLAYTPYGGVILKVSCTKYPGNGKLEITGMLGDVMKESVKIAFSYLKSTCQEFSINYADIIKYDYHIHFEEGATPKDGPSAGVTIVTSILSLLSNKIIPNTISMTGEITLRGIILPVGGIKEKIISAISNNIKKLYLPVSNKREYNLLSDEIKKELKVTFVNNYNEIYMDLFFKKK